MTDPREQAQYKTLRNRFLTGGGNGVNVAVGNAVTSHDVTFAIAEPDINYGCLITPSWATTVRVLAAEKLTTGFKVRFGSASAASGDSFDFVVFRQ